MALIRRRRTRRNLPGPSMSLSGWSKETRSRQARGYGRAWEIVRAQVLRRDCGLCQCDQCKGGALRVTLATEVHHITAKAAGGTDDPSNLQAVAHDCHVRITILESGGTQKPKRRIGLDGFPVKLTEGGVGKKFWRCSD